MTNTPRGCCPDARRMILIPAGADEPGAIARDTTTHDFDAFNRTDLTDGGNANVAGANTCRDTAVGFTVQRGWLVFVVRCPLDPAAQPYIRFLFVGSSFCTPASDRHGWRKGRLCRRINLPSNSPSRCCPCRRQVFAIVNMVDIKSSDRGLPSHKFMPMSGVHKPIQRNR